MLPPRSVLITGASRGLGLEFVKQFLQAKSPPDFLFATCRNPENAKELQEVAKSNSSVTIMKLDVNEPSSFDEARKIMESKLGEEGLNLLLNNAGINQKASLDAVTPAMMLETFNTNVNGPLFTTKAFLPLLLRSAQTSSHSNPSSAVVNMSSIMSSITLTETSNAVEYRVSKAALNMLSKILHNELKDKGVHVGVLHPGWVQTDMGTSAAPVTPSQSVRGCLEVMLKMNADNACVLTDYSGKPLPW
ncbi:C-signal-like [Saccostrea echinata]|uniref:C-signal-like n=1 Tax=Saccostrea echinata TaxID=191078 RepID=UPI002A7FA996|nr:C-signal-like [Saccostrea echinata]